MGASGTARRRPDLAGWLRGLHVSGFWVLMLALLVLAVVILSPTLHLYLAQRHQIDDLQASVAEQKKQVAQDRADLARWSDPGYVRSQVRDRLYYVLPGETSYLVIDDRTAAQKVQDEAPVSTKVQKTESDWLGSLLVSTVSAGVTDAAVPGGASGDDGGARSEGSGGIRTRSTADSGAASGAHTPASHGSIPGTPEPAPTEAFGPAAGAP